MLAFGTNNGQSDGMSVNTFSEVNVGGVVLSDVNDAIALQSINASSPIEVTELPIVTDVSAKQVLNACFPISVTEFGIVIEVSPLQNANAQSPIEVTELGIVNDVSEQHAQKA